MQVIRMPGGISRADAFNQGLDRMQRGFENLGEVISRKEALEYERQRQAEQDALAEQERRARLAMQYDQAAINAGINPMQGASANQRQEFINQGGATGLAGALGDAMLNRVQSERDIKQIQRDQAQQKQRDEDAYLKQKRALELQGMQKKLQPGLAGVDRSKVKQNQWAAAGFARRGEQALDILNKLDADAGTSQWRALKGVIPEGAKPEDWKSLDQAQENFLMAILRKESGAAISDKEKAEYGPIYFAEPGDTPQVLAQKSQARRQAMANLKAEAGEAYDLTPSVAFEAPSNLPERQSQGLGLNTAQANDFAQDISKMSREQLEQMDAQLKKMGY